MSVKLLERRIDRVLRRFEKDSEDNVQILLLQGKPLTAEKYRRNAKRSRTCCRNAVAETIHSHANGNLSDHLTERLLGDMLAMLEGGGK
jgi:hypothetical protein